MSKQIRVEHDGNLLRFGDKWYRFEVNNDGDFRTGTHVLTEVNKKKIDEWIAFVSEKLFSFVDPKVVLKDALKDMLEEDVEKLYHNLKNRKSKVKPILQKHCVTMRVGGVRIPIRG